ncbi:MAG: pyridoxal phosphate-dependent aminotransferase [Bdellovibrionales bacterium]
MVQLTKSATELELSPTLAANETVVRRRAQGLKVMHMGFGQSPFPVPERLKTELAQRASNKDYLPTTGHGPLCDIIKQYHHDHLGIDTDKYDVIIGPGSKLLIYALQMAIKGSLLMPVPSWVSYAPQAIMIHTNVIKVPTTLDDKGLHIDAEELRDVIINAREEGMNPSKIILNYPNNPTGLTIPDDELEAIAKVCQEEDILIISDEIYGLLSFDGKYRTISKYAPEHTAITTGLSKYMSLGGWRLGIGFVPKAIPGLHSLLCNIASETWSCVASPVQEAAMSVYEGHDDIEKFIKDSCDIHALVNTYIAQGLRDAGIACTLPQGAFYNFPNFDAYKGEINALGVRTSREFSQYMLEHYGIASIYGKACGTPRGQMSLRLSGCDYKGEDVLAAYQNGEALNEDFIARNTPNVKDAVETFAQFMDDLKGGRAKKAA